MYKLLFKYMAHYSKGRSSEQAEELALRIVQAAIFLDDGGVMNERHQQITHS
jgi:hypothetical protein